MYPHISGWLGTIMNWVRGGYGVSLDRASFAVSKDTLHLAHNGSQAAQNHWIKPYSDAYPQSWGYLGIIMSGCGVSLSMPFVFAVPFACVL